jgi:hypothetical protein
MSQGYTDGKPATGHYPATCAKYKKDYETACNGIRYQIGLCTTIPAHDACMDAIDQFRAEMVIARKNFAKHYCQELDT